MKKKYMIAYNIIETDEKPAFWNIEKNGKEGD